MIGALKQQSLLLARAIVRANDDPDGLGRIQVEYPSFQGVADQLPSEWARICLPYASSDSGMWFIPEIGDEVLVFFEGGSVDYPIIIGSLYSDKRSPPASNRGGDYNADNKNDLRYFKTRSGHQLCFDDSSDDGGVYLKDSKENKLEIHTKEEKILLSDKKDNRVEIDTAAGKLSVSDAKGNHLTIEGSKISLENEEGSMLKIDGSKIDLENSGGDKVSLNGGKAVVHASSAIKLGDSAMFPLIKGDIFVKLFNAHTHSLGPAVTGPPVAPIPEPSVLSQKVKTS